MSAKENLTLDIKRHFENISNVYYTFVDRCWHSQGYRHSQELRFVLQNLPRQGDHLILDAGCGPGRYTVFLAKRGQRVVAFDLAFNMLKEIRLTMMKENISGHVNWANGDIRYLSFKDNSFDAIINIEVLEHLPNYLEDVTAVLKECYRVLKPKGILITETPLKAHYYLSKVSLLYPWNWFKPKGRREGISKEETIKYFINAPLKVGNLFFKRQIERIFVKQGFSISKRRYIQILQAGFHKRFPFLRYIEDHLEKIPVLNGCAKEIIWCLQKK